MVMMTWWHARFIRYHPAQSWWHGWGVSRLRRFSTPARSECWWCTCDLWVVLWKMHLHCNQNFPMRILPCSSVWHTRAHWPDGTTYDAYDATCDMSRDHCHRFCQRNFHMWRLTRDNSWQLVTTRDNSWIRSCEALIVADPRPADEIHQAQSKVTATLCQMSDVTFASDHCSFNDCKNYTSNLNYDYKLE